MNKLSLDTIDRSVFKVNAAEAEGSNERANLISAGRVLFYEHSRKGKAAMASAMKQPYESAAMLNAEQYNEMNKRFQAEHLLYAANKVCEFNGMTAPNNFDEFKRMGQNFYGNAQFYAVLQGIYTEIITPILPRVYSEAMDYLADVVEVGFGETAQITVGSNDVPVFQDSAWGASRSVPANRFYGKDITLNPTPRTAEIRMKWHQLVGNNIDFGQFFANITAGLYAKTMGVWNAAMTNAITGTAYIPSGLTYTFDAQNWVALANKLSAVNNTPISNIYATGSAVALAKVLPTDVTGATNVNMDAAIATLLGADYNRMGYLGEYMAVNLRPLVDVVIPGTQNGNVTTMLPSNKIFMLAGNGRKPMTIAYNRDTPIAIEITPEKTSSFEMIFNLTIAMDTAAVFANKVGLINI